MASDDVTASRPDDTSLPAESDYSTDTAGARLQRQYAGEFSWLAMIAPTELEPEHVSAVAGRQFVMSVVIFNRRDIPTAAGFAASQVREGMVSVQLNDIGIGGGEVTLQDGTSNAETLLDMARSGQWLLLCRYEPVPTEGGQYAPMPVFAWERIVAASGIDSNTANPAIMEKSLTLSGADWPQPNASWVAPNDARVQWKPAIPSSAKNWNTYACLVPDVVAVYQRSIRLDGPSLWQ